ncbi:hypothetical protein FQN60_015315, partial [Etheostoma spectabile]
MEWTGALWVSSSSFIYITGFLILISNSHGSSIFVQKQSRGWRPALPLPSAVSALFHQFPDKQRPTPPGNCMLILILDLQENQKESIHNAEQGLAKLKAERDTLYKRMGALKCFIEPTVALIKKCSEESPDDFLTLKRIMEGLKGVVEENTALDAQAEWIDASIAKLEQDLGKWKTIHDALEELHAELAKISTKPPAPFRDHGPKLQHREEKDLPDQFTWGVFTNLISWLGFSSYLLACCQMFAEAVCLKDLLVAVKTGDLLLAHKLLSKVKCNKT